MHKSTPGWIVTCCGHTILGWIKLLASCTHAISPQYLLRLNVFCLNISHTHCKSELMIGQTCSKHGDFAGWHSSGLYCSRGNFKIRKHPTGGVTIFNPPTSHEKVGTYSETVSGDPPQRSVIEFIDEKQPRVHHTSLLLDLMYFLQGYSGFLKSAILV